ncbi:DUF3108 domain-containing protein [Geomesophilobacter sediminis]|uniref:DUF3108 domain-containing protein n=1 Tax=Geomesophilobacter sediminis TaxID=2798584 RepID=A0A8J7JEC9_9BACT|nr:DUF3108 domain-containing protein [Geomesophilobacter sediminis]MBJ6725918.1 DUF3108 domain-containing protein [Geomesophilobacter sediminis]
MKKIILSAILLLLFAIPGYAVSLPERLVYDVSWTGISAGRTVQEAKVVGDEIRIVSTTKSLPWLKVFFPVDDRIESYVMRSGAGGKMGLPRIYRERMNEGRTHTDKQVFFDHRKQTALTKDYRGKSEKEDPIGNNTYDTLSAIYFMRGIEMIPGKSVFIEIFDCKRLWRTEVQVLRREEITTPLGTFKTVVVKPLLKSPGIFARTGDIHIWVTDDVLRLPVKMTSKVKIGSITATLIGGTYWQNEQSALKQ